MDLELFFGRFHPLFVHLPIGLMTMAAILELVGWLTGKTTNYSKAIAITYLMGFLTGMLTIASGLMLAGEGGYDRETLNTHKLLGFAVVLMSMLAYLAKIRSWVPSAKFSVGLSALLLVVVSMTGHLGGVLTHGEGYLTRYAPEFIKRFTNDKKQNQIGLVSMHKDSIQIYDHMIKPIFEAKCVSCHGLDKSSGGLDLSSFDDLFKEAETTHPIVKGHADKSGIFNRVSLPNTSEKFMPPTGQPLTYGEMELLKWWIEQGADSLARFNARHMTPGLMALMKRDYQLDFEPKPYYQEVTVQKTDSLLLQELSKIGVKARYLSHDNFLMDVTLDSRSLEPNQRKGLENIADKVVFLSIADANFNGQMPDFSRFKHLMKLDIHGSSIADEDIRDLANLEHLEVVNLYKTSITRDGLNKILKNPSIKQVYAWQTLLSRDELVALADKYPEVNIVSGFEWN